MAGKKGEGESLRCSFCNKDQRDVKKLIAGPTVYICDECVDICLDIIAEERELDEPKTRLKLPKPVEIRDFLGVESLGYISLEGLLACERDGGSFCHACFSGRYPIPIDPTASKLSLEQLHRTAGTGAGR